MRFQYTSSYQGNVRLPWACELGLLLLHNMYCVKSIRFRSFSGPYFHCIRPEYGEILGIFPYSVRMRENTDKKNSEY